MIVLVLVAALWGSMHSAPPPPNAAVIDHGPASGDFTGFNNGR